MDRKQPQAWMVSVVAALVLAVIWMGLDTTLAQGPQPQGAESVSTAFTFQGRLLLNGVPVAGQQDLRVSIWDSSAGGVQLGPTVDYANVPVSGGLVTLSIEPSALNSVFTGDPRWLQIAVRPGASVGAFTTLSRMPITPAPYAWGLMPGSMMTAEPTAFDGWLFRLQMTGSNPAAAGVLSMNATGTAVRGVSDGGSGVVGTTLDGYAVSGYDMGTTQGRGYGGYFASANGVGVMGQSAAARSATNQYAPGVYGRSESGVGVYAVSDASVAFIPAIRAESKTGIGVSALSNAATGAAHAVVGVTRSSLGHGGHFSNIFSSSDQSQVGVWAGTYYGNIIEGWELDSSGSPQTRRFRVRWNGAVYADNSYNCGLGSGCFNTGIGADVAERIDVRGVIAAGDVVEIDPESEGQFRLSSGPFSALVAGVASTNPAITLNNNDLANNDSGVRTDQRPLLALVGQVPVNVTAENGPIQAGDLLVTSSTPGYAMRAGPNAPAGTIIGKALQKFESARGSINMLVMLR